MLELEPGHEPAIVALAELLVGGRPGRRGARAAGPHPRDGGDPPRGRAGPRRRRWSTTSTTSAPTLDALLDQVKADDEARQEFVDLLELLGPDDPRTADYRRKLTARLY